MKEKILVALKTKYSNLGFGAKALDGVASILENPSPMNRKLKPQSAGSNLSLKFSSLTLIVHAPSTTH